MLNLLAASLLFLAIHLGVSGTALRDVITRRIGEGPYRGLFALASLGAVVWLCIAFNHADASADNMLLFDAGQGLRNLAIPVMAVAFALVVPGVLGENPTSAGQEKAALRGVHRITRHPFLWGAAIWSGYHLAATGTLASTIFFASFLIVALIGTRAIDRKARRRDGARWNEISAQTSNLPFAAIIQARNKFVAREYFDWRFAVAFALFAGFLWFHAALFSASPFPNGWLPG
ncbi:MAG: NnrU family protein [Alphaproteobacteria bacterium]|nr:NnrU family protein [Alphaproteobacteria bacterium]